MASESSSAVLDLNDVDTEDTEPPSTTDDTQLGVPLIMEHGYDIAVKVDAPMKQLSTLETFVTYRVRCVCARWSTPTYVRRRYNHFKVLHSRLCRANSLLAPPALPPLHSARQQLDRYSPSFVCIRTLALNAFLDRIAKHPILTHSEDFRLFLTTPDEEFDKVFKSENSALNLWGLSSALYGSGEAKNTNGARVKDPEFTSAADYLQSLQQKLTTLCSLTTKLYKGTAAVSTEYMSMKRACDSWASGSRGGVARGVCAVSAAANAARGACANRARRVQSHRAILPLLAASAAAHHQKIRQRDAMHAAYIAGSGGTDDLHNRLEQASEALRSELADWVPKTRADVKNLLLDLADDQMTLHSQMLMGWEHALKLSSDPKIEDMFKTVSKSAVQNLSPFSCRTTTPTETERESDLDIDSETDSKEISLNYDQGTEDQGFTCNDVTSDHTIDDEAKDINPKLEELKSESKKSSQSEMKSSLFDDENILDFEQNDQNLSSDHLLATTQNSKQKTLENNDQNVLKADKPLEKSLDKIDMIDKNERIININNDDFIQEVLEDSEIKKIQKDYHDDNNDKISDEPSTSEGSLDKNNKTDVVSDPLTDFADVDLS